MSPVRPEGAIIFSWRWSRLFTGGGDFLGLVLRNIYIAIFFIVSKRVGRNFARAKGGPKNFGGPNFFFLRVLRGEEKIDNR